MQINCEVIRDLLPLYADGLTSESTSKRVKEHLVECATCAAAFKELETESRENPASQIHVTGRGLRTVWRRRLLPVFAVILAVLTILAGYMVYCTVPVWLNAEEAVAGVELRKSTKTIKLDLTDRAYGWCSMFNDPAVTGVTLDDEYTASGIWFYGYRNDLFFNSDKKLHYVSYKPGRSVWYRGDLTGEADTLLYGDGKATFGPVIEAMRHVRWDPLDNHTVEYAFCLSVFVGIVSLVVWFILRKKTLGRLAGRVCLLMLCSMASCLFVTDGRMLCDVSAFGETGYLLRYAAILVMAFLSWGSTLCICGSIRQRRYMRKL